MSPEQATGRNIAAPCDIYSLGVIAYEALTGHPPFDGRTLAEVVCMHLTSEPAPLAEQCNAPAELCELIERMLEKDPRCARGAIEIRQVARAIARELTSAYEEMEIHGERPRAHQPRTPAQIIPSDELYACDPETLEFGVTEMLPVVPSRAGRRRSVASRRSGGGPSRPSPHETRWPARSSSSTKRR